MSIVNAPRFGGIADVTESLAAAAGSATPIVRNVTIGPSASSPTTAVPATLTPGTGGPKSVNQVVDGIINLAGNATLTIDLNAFTATAGSSKTLTKCRGFHFVNTGAADAGSTYAFTINAAASNGFTAGGQIPASGSPATVMPNSSINGVNFSTAGWTVSGSAKQVVVTAGSAGATGYFVFIGE